MKNKLIVNLKTSALKHGIQKEDILYVVDNPILDNMIEIFPEKYLIIGFDRNGNLLEIVYELENDEILKVFHAMKCRKSYISILRQQFGR